MSNTTSPARLAFASFSQIPGPDRIRVVANVYDRLSARAWATHFEVTPEHGLRDGDEFKAEVEFDPADADTLWLSVRRPLGGIVRRVRMERVS